MLVSHKYKFIYTKTIKTASTSIESFLERFCMPESDWVQLHAREEYESSEGIIGFRGDKIPDGTKWWNHMSAELIRERLGNKTWNSYIKFCSIRNPFEKCISAYEHFGRCLYGQAGEANGQQVKSAPDRITQEQQQFLHYVSLHPPIDREQYMLDGKFCLDNVIRYESLIADIKCICLLIGIPFERKYLPSFKMGIRRPEATAISLYTEASRQVVSEKFAIELNLFKYNFPAC